MDTKPNIPELLLTENKIKLLSDYTNSKKHHEMECLVCNHIWSATPKSKRQTLKKYGVGGCPNCHKQRHEDNTVKLLKDYLIDTNLILIEITGRDESANKLLARVKNVKCNHEFVSRVNNIMNAQIECPTCNTERKRDACRRQFR